MDRWIDCLPELAMVEVSEGVCPAVLEESTGVSHLPRGLLHQAVVGWELPPHLLLLNLRNGDLQAL